jgi:hypothetical protein
MNRLEFTSVDGSTMTVFDGFDCVDFEAVDSATSEQSSVTLKRDQVIHLRNWCDTWLHDD